jgi:hypothetical protein
MVLVDERTLQDSGRRPIGRCELLDGTPLSTAAARRLACDSSYINVIVGPDGVPIAVGRRTRSVSRRLRRALIARDRTCQYPGCARRGFVDAHHIVPWTGGGATTLANLCLLCRHHHTFVHDRDYRIVKLDDGTFVFFEPSGTMVPRGPTLPEIRGDALAEAVARLAADGVTVDASTAVPRTDRDVKPDYSWCVEAVLDRTPGTRWYRPRAAPAA